MRVVSVYKNFANTGGAQSMALLLARHFSEDELPVVLTATPSDRIDNAYKGKADFRKLSLKNLLTLAPGSVFLSHDRMSTTRLMLYRNWLRLPLQIVHVAHNTFSNLRFATLFPKRVVVISTGVKTNLTSYFHVPEDRITLIPNGINDRGVRAPRSGKGVRILLAGRICRVKRQVEIAAALRGKLPMGTELHFAGTGDQADVLLSTIANEPSMAYLGHVDIDEVIADYDYVLLFSEKEGLPLSLIESCMYGRPMITNDLPSVLDVNTDSLTGFVCSDFSYLVSTIASLPDPESDAYIAMAAAARERYEQKFRLETMLEAYERILFCDNRDD